MTDGTPATTEDPSAAHRLPYSIEPHRYDLRLAPDLASASFTGQVRIAVTAHERVGDIQLNALDLAISSATVTDPRGTERSAEPVLDPGRERLVLDLAEPLDPGPATIAIEFSGTLNDQLHGFYRSTFTDTNGETCTIATTQFEATDARRAFPCFDEPDRKAVFSVTLDIAPTLRAFSNGPVVAESKLDDGRLRVRFADTIPMSSYLVACVVGPLEATEPVDVDGTAVRVVHAPHKGELCGFALDAAAHALRFFTEWFGLPYPADKLDLVAIPDFAFGAMENLGCVTFREVLVLVDPERASRLELERVADVISHEIAHMWFGDLVTMRWWNGIWLNEAFATFMELLCVDHFRPQWERWTSFGMERDAAMATDALHSTRPVEYPVGPPEEAQGMFDILTYQKGAGVLRMLEQYLGAERFREGVRRYLTQHRLSNTETSDLWDAIEGASGEPVREIMDSWILQGGFPLVSVSPGVSVNEAPSHPGTSEAASGLALSQEPFSYATRPEDSAIGSLWQVPVIARAVGGPDAAGTRVLLRGEPVTLELDASTPKAPAVVVNAGGAGYYRVSYPVAHLRRLTDRLGDLDPLERSNLLGDTWAAVVAGRSDLGDFLLVAEALGEQEDPDAWTRITTALGFLDHAVEDRTRPLLAAYGRALLGPMLERLGWGPRAGEGERTPSLRAQVIGTLGTVGADPAVRSECAAREQAALSGSAAVDPDLAAAVVGVVAASSGPDEYEAFLHRSRHPATPQEEVRYRHALAGFRDPGLAERTFTLAMTEVRSQDVPFLVQLLLASRENGAATWERVRDSWDALVARVPSQSVPRMLEGVKLLCRDPALAREVRAFVDAHPLRTGQRTVEQALERLDVNVAFAARLRAITTDVLAAGIERLGGG